MRISNACGFWLGFCWSSPSWSRKRRNNKQRGSTALETTLLLPLIFIFILLSLQIAFILLAAQSTQYASYMAARSYMVYGEATLGSLQYPYTAANLGMGNLGGLLTDEEQTAAEAAAEKIIFESLPWERDRIVIADESDWIMKRLYLDGIDGGSSAASDGSVRVEFVTDPAFHQMPGVRVTYCMPALFPGIESFVTALSQQTPNPCQQVDRVNNVERLAGIPISYSTYLGREP